MSSWQAWLYVAAVLIPLVAFVIQFVGMPRLGRRNALLATAAVGVSCLLSLTGLILYSVDHPAMLRGHEAGAAHSGEEVAHAGETAHNPGRADTAWTLDTEWVALGEGLAGPGSPALRIPLGVRIDALAAVMFAMVSLVAFLIHLYSMGYMAEDPGYPRFFAFLSLFCFSMLGLVASATIFMVFVFWELVGLCSYLLIGFWYQEKVNCDAANKAFIVNRIGDAGMIIGLGILWTTLGTFNIAEINRGLRDSAGELNVVTAAPGDMPAESRVELRNPRTGQALVNRQTRQPFGISSWLLTIAGLGIFAGCVGKSAQFPLHVWLPDAMAGPTPVSALIHAATMVAAGVYLVGRFYPLFTDGVLLWIGYTGAITLIIGATIACVQLDYKKVLAYSTVSQLGFMMLGLGVGGWAAGLFHLITHAFFKALLFLGAGSVYHAVHTYEMPRLGGLWRKMPVTGWTMLIGTAAISGVPLLSGFYSKDAILASALAFVQEPGQSRHLLLLLLPIVGAALTAFYMFRMWFLLFVDRKAHSALATQAGHAHADHDHDDPVAHAHESPSVMTWPLRILALFAVIAGWPWLVVPVVGGTPVLESMLASASPVPLHEHGLSLRVAAFLLSITIAGLGIFAAYACYVRRSVNSIAIASRFAAISTFLQRKWYFDELYDRVFVRPTLALARVAAGIDRFLIDGLINGSAALTEGLSRLEGAFDLKVIDGLVNLAGRGTYAVGRAARLLQTGRLRQYLMMLALGVVVLFLGLYRWIQS